MAILRRFTIAALVSGVAMCGAAAEVTTSVPTAAQIRTGYLYNFAMFVEWPAVQAGQPLIVGVLGDDTFAFALQQIDGRKANGRTIVVKRVDEADDLGRTSILYIGSDDDRIASAALARVSRSPVLTIGASPRFTQIGGIIRLYYEEARLRFEINVSRSQENDLRISSKLLGLAKVVKEPK